ncbi:hypothetical protein [Agreia sp. VKM Ac-1783]|uniref:hypothetical protein n=1 Tax=Agreia sp. VKM Ac-1783 TaxID=1938889 RepID=UPI000A2AC9A4|nr:hypothetical protein [Agreia sp. VKM Ac-1783]SMQ74213.1 ornithine cyclodeaminase [Agreia sp. VKM Ac-1783]
MFTEFLYLSDADMRLSGVDNAASCVDVADEVFRILHAQDYVMGGPKRSSHGMGLPLPETSSFSHMPTAGPDRRFVTMPAYVGGRFDICGNKWYGSNPRNVERGLPRSVLTLMLNDKHTGEPLAFMSANRLSAARTGAVPAVASRYLVRSIATTLAVVGCGVVNRAVVRALLTQQPSISSIVCHNRSREKAEDFVAWLRAEFHISARLANDAQDCVRDADIVSVAASRTAPLFIPADAFAPNAVILLSGPMQSDSELWTESEIVYDHIPLHQDYVEDSRAAGSLEPDYGSLMGAPLYELIDKEFLPPLDESRDLGAVIAGGQSMKDDKRVVFLACGMAVFDVAWGFDVLQTARREGIGKPMELWGTSDRFARDGEKAARSTHVLTGHGTRAADQAVAR